MVERCQIRDYRTRAAKATQASPSVSSTDLNQQRAVERAVSFLDDAEGAVEGEGGDHRTYVVACRLKDYGVAQDVAFALLASKWNNKCSPPWPLDELERKVRNAYEYGIEPIGESAPERDFDRVGTQDVGSTSHSEGNGKAANGVMDELEATASRSPVLSMNEHYAFVQVGGGHRILWETQDEAGRDTVIHLSEQTFHRMHAAKGIMIGKTTRKVSQVWMEHPERRTFDRGIVFMPGHSAPPGYYNHWRGWPRGELGENEKVRPEWRAAVDRWLEHIHENIVEGNDDYFRWLVSWFAQIVQRPDVCSPVALALRGGRGTGKNSVMLPIQRLLGSYAVLTSNRRYLTSNFNSHLERCLLLVLDEAYWSGDKAAEGTLKDLITGGTHVIEHKGKEPYTVANLTRVALLSNEDWVVPAGHDERRYAVFELGTGRKQDRAYFQAMMDGFNAHGGGGYRLLMRELRAWDCVDTTAAPATRALGRQKLQSLPAEAAWWFTCLSEETIAGFDFDGWPEEIEFKILHESFVRWAKREGFRFFGRHTPSSFSRKLREFCSEIQMTRPRRNNEKRKRHISLPELEVCKTRFEDFIGHPVEWADAQNVSEADQRIRTRTTQVVDLLK